MEAATVPQIKKRAYRNNTGGYLGVVKLDHKGEEKGENVEPYGTVWLSDAEAILTARAPRRPEDNPFEAQPFVRLNPETGAREEYLMRPLTLAEDDERLVPINDRYVPPGVDSNVGEVLGAAEAAAPEREAAVEREREILAQGGPPVAREQAATPATVAAPPSTGSADPSASAPPPAPPVAPQGGPTPAPRTQTALGGSPVGAANTVDESEGQSWVTPPEAPGQVLSGALAGEDGPPAGEAAAAQPDPTAHVAGPPPVAGQAQAAVQTPGAEEHAAVDPAVGEETGAAKPPTQPQPEGEFAQAEEVGSPDAPESNDQSLVGG